MRNRQNHHRPYNEASPKQDGKERIKWTDRWLAIATIVLAVATIFLSWYTYQLFKDASMANDRNKEAIEATKKSADATVAAVAEQRRNDSISAYNDSIRTRNDSIHNERNFKLQGSAIEAQIDQLHEAQREFEKENEPILDISEARLNYFLLPNKPMRFAFKIENLGKYPAQVIDSKTSIKIGKEPSSYSYIKISDDTINKPRYIDEYITNNKPLIDNDYLSNGNLTEKHFNAIIDSNYFIYLSGYVRYKNLIKNTTNLYEFCVRIHPNIKTKIIINRNIYDVKK